MDDQTHGDEFGQQADSDAPLKRDRKALRSNPKPFWSRPAKPDAPGSASPREEEAPPQPLLSHSEQAEPAAHPEPAGHSEPAAQSEPEPADAGLSIFAPSPVDASPVDASPVDAGPVDAGPVGPIDPDPGEPDSGTMSLSVAEQWFGSAANESAADESQAEELESEPAEDAPSISEEPKPKRGLGWGRRPKQSADESAQLESAPLEPAQLGPTDFTDSAGPHEGAPATPAVAATPAMTTSPAAAYAVPAQPYVPPGGFTAPGHPKLGPIAPEPRAPRRGLAALDIAALVTAIVVPPIGLITAVVALLRGKRVRGWASDLARSAVAVSLVMTVVFAGVGGYVWFTMTENAKHLAAVKADQRAHNLVETTSLPFCNALAEHPEIYSTADPDYGWPGIDAPGGYNSAIAAYSKVWAQLAEVAPSGIAEETAAIAERIAGVVEITNALRSQNRAGDLLGLHEKDDLATVESWYVEYCNAPPPSEPTEESTAPDSAE